MKIAYITRWDKEKEKTWSGTGFSLCSALSNIANVYDFGVSLNKKQEIIEFIFEKLKNKLHLRKNYYLDYLIGKKAKTEIDNCSSVLVLCVPSKFSGKSTYYYIDLTSTCIIDFQETDSIGFNYEGVIIRNHKKLNAIEKDEKDRFSKCAGILTMSKWLCNYIKEKCPEYADKVYHVGGGINIDKEKIDYSKKKGNKILFVGRDFNRKNGPLVVEAFKMLRERYNSDAELYIIGPLTSPLEEDVEGVCFKGEIPSAELYHYFNICDIFCMPSRFEAYGLVFIEALCFGLPCIGRDAYAMPEFIEDGKTGYLIQGDDVEELCEKMNQLLNNDKIKQNVRDNQTGYLYEYSWNTVAERVVEVMCKEAYNKGEKDE